MSDVYRPEQNCRKKRRMQEKGVLEKA